MKKSVRIRKFSYKKGLSPTDLLFLMIQSVYYWGKFYGFEVKRFETEASTDSVLNFSFIDMTMMFYIDMHIRLEKKLYIKTQVYTNLRKRRGSLQVRKIIERSIERIALKSSTT